MLGAISCWIGCAIAPQSLMRASPLTTLGLEAFAPCLSLASAAQHHLALSQKPAAPSDELAGVALAVQLGFAYMVSSQPNTRSLTARLSLVFIVAASACLLHMLQCLLVALRLKSGGECAAPLAVLPGHL